MTKKHWIGLSIGAACVALSLSSQASLYYEPSQSISALGVDLAGAASFVQDASINFYNAAGLTRFQRPQVVLGIAGDYTHHKFSGTVTNAVLGVGTRSNTTSDVSSHMQIVPDFHMVYPFKKHFAFGLSVVQTLQGYTRWNRGTPTLPGPGAYVPKTNITGYDISPSLAYQINKKFSVGAGLDIERAEFDARYVTTAFLPVQSKVNLDNWGVGWHVGFMYQVSPDTRLGASFRSKIVHRLKGNSSFPGGPSYNASLELPTPAVALFSVNHRYDSRLMLLATLRYTMWNVVDKMRVFGIANSAGIPVVFATTDFSEIYNARNTWGVYAGGVYHWRPKWLVRFGLGYEETPLDNSPLSSPGQKTITVPGGNQYSIALGTSYIVNKHFTINAAYAHYFIGDTEPLTPSGRFSVISGPTALLTNAKVANSRDTFGLEAVMNVL